VVTSARSGGVGSLAALRAKTRLDGELPSRVANTREGTPESHMIATPELTSSTLTTDRDFPREGRSDELSSNPIGYFAAGRSQARGAR
jgi:hypothetical protein